MGGFCDRILEPAAIWLSAYCFLKAEAMGRWPDSNRSTFMTFLLIFVLFPLLAFGCWWFVKR
jgi:hypothetical protein